MHFAAYENHLGFYPAPSGIAAFTEELKPYKKAKGSVQFPLGQPLPVDLIRRMVEFRVAENTGKASSKASADKGPAAKASAVKPSADKGPAAKAPPGKPSA